MAYKRDLGTPLAPTYGDDKKKKKKTTKVKMSDLTPAQQKKINSLNLKGSARQKAIKAFDQYNKKSKG